MPVLVTALLLAVAGPALLLGLAVALAALHAAPGPALRAPGRREPGVPAGPGLPPVDVVVTLPADLAHASRR